MASIIDKATGRFLGIGSEADQLSEGQALVYSIPPEGVDDIFFLNGIWLPDRPPSPDHAGAWLALITSPLYARALGLAQTSTPISTELGILAAAFQAYNLLPPDTWAAALSASCQRLAGLINATATPLTEAEQWWVDAWNVTHHLGLTIDWEAP